MDTITQIQVAWELKRVGHRVDEIAEQLGKHRATIYRWLKGIRMRGIRGYVAYFKQAKKGRRV
ncbi:MAG: helix-turn-helix domain-containing protein, partial [Anaerolineae bacterium]|nr:helix-turn-helix domain-containing protein [Anaerolineae bacterium]